MESKTIEYKADEQSEANEKKLIEETVQKWLLLQKTVKEEITLEEIILNQQQSDFNNLKLYFKQYYDYKLKSRKIYEDIRNLKINAKNTKSSEIKEYIIDDEIDKTFLQACEPVKNLLFLFRNNYDYVLKLISLIDYQDEKEQIESLVELLCKNLGAYVPTDDIKEFKETYFDEGVVNYEKFLVFFAEHYPNELSFN